MSSSAIYYFFLLTLFLCCPGLLIAQNNTSKYLDSLKNVIEKTDDDSIKVSCYMAWDNEIYLYDEDLDVELNEKIIELCDRNLNQSNSGHTAYFNKMLGRSSNNLGIVFTNRGDYQTAIAYLSKALKVATESNNLKTVADAHNNLGNIYSDLNNFEACLNHYEKAQYYSKEIGNDVVALAVMGNIAFVYSQFYAAANDSEKLNYLDTTVLKYQIVLKESERLLSSEDLNPFNVVKIKSYQVNAYNGLSEMYLSSEFKDSALVYSQKALDISEETDNNRGISSSLNILAKYFFDIKDYKSTITYSEKGLNIARENGDIRHISSTSLLLWKVYKKVNNYKLALENYELHVKMRDSINSIVNEKASIQQEFQTRYEQESLKDSLNHINAQRLKDEQIEKQEIALKSERNQKIGLSIFAGLLAVLAVVIFRGLRQKKRDNKIISSQKEEVEHHRKKIIDSITYAEKIQESLLPNTDEIKSHLPGFSNLNLPKDIVSGDFYWFYNDGGKSYLVLSDCTGHGVPGAFMSMIGSTLLKEIISGQKSIELHDVLEKLDQGLIEILKQYDEDASEDGMELAILKFDHESGQYSFAGANQNLYLVKEKDVEIIKGNLRSLGGWVRKRSRLPEFETILVDHKDVLAMYLTTDGLEDQLGGENFKKFGRKTFIQLISEMRGNPDMSILEQQFLNWKGQHEQLDDVSVIGIKIS